MTCKGLQEGVPSLLQSNSLHSPIAYVFAVHLELEARPKYSIRPESPPGFHIPAVKGPLSPWQGFMGTADSLPWSARPPPPPSSGGAPGEASGPGYGFSGLGGASLPGFLLQQPVGPWAAWASLCFHTSPWFYWRAVPSARALQKASQ